LSYTRIQASEDRDQGSMAATTDAMARSSLIPEL